MKKFRVILLTSGLALTPNLLLSPVMGEASSARMIGPRLVSGSTPLPPAEPVKDQHDHPSDTGHCGSDSKHQDWETDSSIAASPANNANLVTAWIQDWADAIVVAHSTDTGRTWTKSIPQTSGCTLRPGSWVEPVPDFVKALSGHTSALDPWLSFGPRSGGAPQGTVYLTSVVQGGAKNAVIANRSTDGGSTWGDPEVLAFTEFPRGFDSSYVIADPARAGHAYAVWVETDFASSTREQQVSRTVNGGKDWVKLPPILSRRLPFFGELLIHPDGTLVNVAAEVPPQTIGAAAQAGKYRVRDVLAPDVKGQFVGPTTVVARRLPYGGSTWTDPVDIAIADLLHATGARSAMAPDGTIYASWMREHESGFPAGSMMSLMYSKSLDGAVTWSRAAGGDCGSADDPALARPPGCVGPSTKGPPVTGSGIAVAGDGSVGVLFYDYRNGDPGTSKATDVWFRRSGDGGSEWTETHVAGPYDGDTKWNDTLLNEVGDYQGVTAAAGGFATTYSVSEPLEGANFSLQAAHTDIFFSWLPAANIPNI